MPIISSRARRIPDGVLPLTVRRLAPGVGQNAFFLKKNILIIFSHPPKRRRVTYASTIRPASASASVSTLSTSMKPLHGIISYCTCILV